MKEKKIKTFATLLLALIVGVCGTGCAKTVDGGIELDPNKETILVQVHGGGYGSDWAVKMLSEYNKMIADKYDGRFQFGKKQDVIEVIDVISKQISSGVNGADIFFTDECNMTPAIQTGKLLDLAPVWDATPDAAEPTRKLSEKFAFGDELVEIVKGSKGTERYAIPYTMGVSGIIYDHDLFEEMGWLIKDGADSSKLSKGNDGKFGTYDDGLPSTLAEWRTLLDNIMKSQMIPYVLMGSVGTGGGSEHVEELVWAQYEGIESYKTSFSYKGKMYRPDTQDTVDITPATGYRVYAESQGRDKGIDIVSEYILGNRGSETLYHDESLTLTHTKQEEKFLYSHNEGKRIAMLLNGNWWENEARRVFESDVKENKGDTQWAFGNRDFRFLPVPQIEGQHPSSNNKSFFSVNSYGTTFAVRSNDEMKNQAILDFLTYFASDAGLTSFTQSVGVLPAYRVKLSDDVLKTLSPFGRNYYEIAMSDSAVIVTPMMERYANRAINVFNANAPKRFVYQSSETKSANSTMRAKLGKDNVPGETGEEKVENYKSGLKSVWNSENWSQTFGGVI